MSHQARSPGLCHAPPTRSRAGRELPNGNLEVGVHIADVTHFLKPGTAMDDEAAARATTTYLVQRRIDMLPKPLTEDICSLRCDRGGGAVFWRGRFVLKHMPVSSCLCVWVCACVSRSAQCGAGRWLGGMLARTSSVPRLPPLSFQARPDTTTPARRGGVERLTFSAIWEMTHDAEIVSTRFTKGVIRSRAAMTYAEAQSRIDDPSQHDEITLGALPGDAGDWNMARARPGKARPHLGFLFAAPASRPHQRCSRH